MVFLVVDDGIGTTEYFSTEGVLNGTGIAWTDYHLDLGFGTGGSFVSSTAGDGLDFDSPHNDSPIGFGPFSTIVIGEDTIDAYDAIVVPGGFYNFGFSIDVPNGISEFTIRQYPTIVPEPGTALLLAFGLLGLGARRRNH